MTQRARFSFSAKQYPDGSPFIICEPMTGDLKITERGFLGFDLPEGVAPEKVSEIVAFLNENIVHVTYTEL